MFRKLKLVFVVGLLAVQGSCGNYGPHNPIETSKARLETTIRWLNNQDDEDILRYEKVNRYLSTHKVFISLTTSPKRIRYLQYVFRTLNLQHVEKIILNIPEHFGRDQSTYTIPEYIAKHPKVVVNVIPKDLGPLTKLVPGVEYIRAHYDAALAADFVLMTVDDDTGYGRGAVNAGIKAMVLNSYKVVAASAPSVRNPDWHIDHLDAWPMKSDESIVEGFGGVFYRLSAVKTEKMREIIAKEAQLGVGKNCYLSDDMVISYTLALEGTHRYVLDTKYYNLSKVKQFDYGHEEDALHRGAGDSTLAKENSGNANDLKYNRCFNFLSAYFPAK